MKKPKKMVEQPQPTCCVTLAQQLQHLTAAVKAGLLSPEIAAEVRLGMVL
jgi:hypothetical protein